MKSFTILVFLTVYIISHPYKQTKCKTAGLKQDIATHSHLEKAFVAGKPTLLITIGSVVETPTVFSTYNSAFEDMDPSLVAIEGLTTVEDSIYVGGLFEPVREEIVLAPIIRPDVGALDPETARIVPIQRHIAPYGAPPSPILHAGNIDRSDLLQYSAPVYNPAYGPPPVIYTNKSEGILVEEYDDVISAPIDFSFTDW